MRKLIVLSILLAVGSTLGFSETAMAQKKHAPKGVWKAMGAGLNDIQSITAALAVFDMKRAATIADELVKRETFISKIERLSEATRKGHAKVADAAKELADAARLGEEREIAMKIGAVLAACSACHFDIRDKKRREKMQ